MEAAPADLVLVDDLTRFQYDPLGFVLYAFEWGSGELAGHAGPRSWQRDVLTEIGQRLRDGGDLGSVIQTAVASGHGIGKSALVSWLILWAISTYEDTRGVVTANTEVQLRTKTWAELAKWHRLAINSPWFTLTATALFSSQPGHDKTWRIDAIAQNEHNPEAFAGLHNQGRRILVIFDEASGIPDIIWEVVGGALSDARTQIVWAVFGNTTQPQGRFRDCFGKYAHRWTTRQIDARTVEGVNIEQIAKDVADHGEDSDYVRIRWRGVFPRAGECQLIPSDLVAASASTQRTPHYLPTDPVIIGVDVARFGKDESTIYTRKGRDCRTIPAKVFRGLDNMQLAAQLAAHLAWLEQAGAPADAVFIDEGAGGGVIDRMRQLGHKVIAINFGGTGDAVDGILVRNKAAEMWVRARAWLGSLVDGGCLPYNDPVLTAQLESRQYGYDKDGRIVLESKDDMARRGVGSPDRADGFVLTFAQPVGSARQRAYEDMNRERKRYDPLARVRG